MNLFVAVIAQTSCKTSRQEDALLTHPTLDFGKPFSGARWFDVLPRAALCPEISKQVLLHAGPPYRGAPPIPVINSAIQALLFEGWAADAAAARDLLQHGEVLLRPAQDHGIVTPLAQVVSASMLLVAVEQHDRICYAPLIEGAAPALRFGSAAPECVQRLRQVGARFQALVAPLVRSDPVKIDAVIRAAVAAGDECHASTAAADAALLSQLARLDADCAAELGASPTWALPIIMAAAAVALLNSRCAIASIGGNGIDFGIRRRDEQRWRHMSALAPQGSRFAGLDALTPLPAIGDSAIIDFCGLGGQALSATPQWVAEWGNALPADAMRQGDLIDPDSGIVDPARVMRHGLAPLINLAILDSDGRQGLIGRGFYRPPLGLFSR
jgi:hypothetical protein